MVPATVEFVGTKTGAARRPAYEQLNCSCDKFKKGQEHSAVLVCNGRTIVCQGDQALKMSDSLIYV